MQKGFTSVIILILAFLMILFLGTGVWYYLNYASVQKQGAQTEAPIPIPTQTTTKNTEIPENWIQYTSATGHITFAHPPEAQVQEEIGEVHIHISGPTQKENTELFDGLALALSTSPLNTATLEEAATTQQAEAAADPIVENVTTVEKISYAEKEGYSYTVTDMGTREVIFLPFAEDLYLMVTNSTVDPTQQNFQQIAEEIIATVTEG